MANYSLGINPIPQVEDGHVFTGDNFLQMFPHTKILEGKARLKFINCNVTNCDLPPDAEVIGASRKHGSFCSHIHPKWIAKGLPECIENCEHVTSVDEVVIDGVALDRIYHYSDKAVSR